MAVAEQAKKNSPEKPNNSRPNSPAGLGSYGSRSNDVDDRGLMTPGADKKAMKLTSKRPALVKGKQAKSTSALINKQCFYNPNSIAEILKKTNLVEDRDMLNTTEEAVVVNTADGTEAGSSGDGTTAASPAKPTKDMSREGLRTLISADGSRAVPMDATVLKPTTPHANPSSIAAKLQLMNKSNSVKPHHQTGAMVPKATKKVPKKLDKIAPKAVSKEAGFFFPSLLLSNTAPAATTEVKKDDSGDAEPSAEADGEVKPPIPGAVTDEPSIPVAVVNDLPPEPLPQPLDVINLMPVGMSEAFVPAAEA